MNQEGPSTTVEFGRNRPSYLVVFGGVVHTAHRTLSSSFLGLPSRILSINHKKELLRGLWVALWGRSDEHRLQCKSNTRNCNSEDL